MRPGKAHAPCGDTRRGVGGEAGFALVVVLLVLALVAAAATSFLLAVRAHIRSTAALTAVSEAEATADGGVHLALQDLLAVREDRTRTRRFTIAGAPHHCRFGEIGTLTIRVEDEAGRVDLNTASERLLRALLAGNGLAADDAVRFADRILDFRDRDNEKRQQGAERADYAAAGLPGPKDAPFDAVDELMQLMGADAVLVERLRAAVTVHSGLAGVDPKVMPSGRVEAIATGDAATAGAFARSTRGTGAGSLPAELIEISPQRVFSIRVEAVTVSGARFVREAVVDLGLRRGRGPEWRRWVRGRAAGLQDASAPPPSTLPPC